MCNLYSQTRSIEAMRQFVRAMQIPIKFPQGIPNLATPSKTAPASKRALLKAIEKAGGKW